VPLRLKALGLSTPATVLTLYAFMALCGGLAWTASFLSARHALMVWAGLGLAGFLLALWLMSIRMPYEEQKREM
jgi:hypothetical protein